MTRILRIVVVGGAWSLAAAVSSLAATAAAGVVWSAMGLEPPSPRWLEGFDAIIDTPDATVRRLVLMVAGAVVFSPLSEEFVFRGLLQGWLMRRMRTAFAVALTGIAFAAVHGSLYAIPPLLAVSVCFSFARIQSGGLAAPAIAHSIYNAAVLTAALVKHGAAG